MQVLIWVITHLLDQYSFLPLENENSSHTADDTKSRLEPRTYTKLYLRYPGLFLPISLSVFPHNGPVGIFVVCFIGPTATLNHKQFFKLILLPFSSVFIGYWLVFVFPLSSREIIRCRFDSGSRRSVKYVIISDGEQYIGLTIFLAIRKLAGRAY